jgi:1-acyl-sn-glycerol-3-phosphate acyltransferase
LIARPEDDSITLSAVADFVYPPVIVGIRTVFTALGLRMSRQGIENLPRTGGAILASNHVSYLDFTFVGWGALPRRRLVRFMAKESVFRHWLSGPLMRGMHHIPVDRSRGSQAYSDAVEALHRGEIIGVFPEATISRSFTVKEIKPGAVRMAKETGVPIIPVAVWGGQRIYTKGRPRDWRRGKAITVLYGEPMLVDPEARVEEVLGELKKRMQGLLDQAQRSYPDSPADDADRWWQPRSLGGSAPTPQEAAALDAAERKRR